LASASFFTSPASDGTSGRRFWRPVTQRELSLDCALVGGLGWTWGRTLVPVAGLTVKAATNLQLGPLCRRRSEYLRAFASEFAPAQNGPSSSAFEAHCKAVVMARRQLWKLRWDNNWPLLVLPPLLPPPPSLLPL
jgi:hypothetical protein